jgi:hypothetical protein
MIFHRAAQNKKHVAANGAPAIDPGQARMTIVKTPRARAPESWPILHSTDRDTAVRFPPPSASLTVSLETVCLSKVD